VLAADGHLYGKEALQGALARIGNPDYLLTPANVDSYLVRLRTGIQNYRPTNSNFPPETTRDF